MSKSRQGKLSYKQRFNLRLPEEIDEFVQDLADDEGISKAAMVVRILRDRQRKGVPQRTETP